MSEGVQKVNNQNRIGRVHRCRLEIRHIRSEMSVDVLIIISIKYTTFTFIEMVFYFIV
jgi:hypothetical protein